MGYKEILKWIREYNLGPDNPSHYDANGVVHLLLAALDNMREHFHEGDLENVCYAFDDEQRDFLQTFTSYALRMTDAEIDEEDAALGHPLHFIDDAD